MSIPILICDDSAMARQQVEKSLPAGWSVDITHARNGEEALEQVRAGKGQVVFLDLTMPVMNGYEVLERLQREATPSCVFVVSADIQPQAVERARALGALEFFRKPIEADYLRDRLQAHGLLQAHKAKSGVGDMSGKVQFTAAQKDGFEELVNIGMGRAGDALARLLGVFVELTAPSIRFVLSENMGPELHDLIQAETISGVRQGFFAEREGGIHGEAIAIFASNNFNELTSLLAFDEDLSDQGKQELLLDISNLLNGACLNGIAAQLGDVLSYSAPHIIGQHIPFYELLDEENLTWEHALVLKVNYKVENRSFTCDLLLLMPERAIEALVQKIDSMLDTL